MFHNYLSQGVSDPSFEKTLQCAAWLSWAARLDGEAHSEQLFAGTQYVPIAALAVKALLAQPGRPKLTAPKVMFSVSQRQSHTAAVLDAFWGPRTRCCWQACRVELFSWTTCRLSWTVSVRMCARSTCTC